MNLRNKKGQVGAIGVVLLFMFFLIIWFVWLGGFVNEIGNTIVIENSLTGLDAFFYSNLNVVILIACLLSMMGYMYFVSR